MRLLELGYLFRLGTLLALRHLELYQITLLESLVPVAIDCGVVNENVRPALLADKTIPFGVVKPLYSSCCSGQLLFLLCFFKPVAGQDRQAD